MRGSRAVRSLLLLGLLLAAPVLAVNIEGSVPFDRPSAYEKGVLDDVSDTVVNGDLRLLPPFVDDFGGTALSTAWTDAQAGGSLTVADGAVTLIGSASTFPFASTTKPVLPADHAFRAEVDYQFITYGGGGDGFGFGPVFVWQDQGTFDGTLLRFYGTRGITEIILAPDLQPHHLAVTFDGASNYTIAVDGSVLVAQPGNPPAQHSVWGVGRSLWMGNPCGCTFPGPWNGFRIDRIVVLPLAGTWTSPSIDVASILPPGLPAPVVMGEGIGSTSWDATVPPGTDYHVFLRTSQDNVTWRPWVEMQNGPLKPTAFLDPLSQLARYGQVRVDMAAPDPLTASPALHGLWLDFLPDLRT